MALYLIGIGLSDEKDITLKGLEAVRRCEIVFLETYTATLSVPIQKLERLYDKKIIPADRVLVESDADKIIIPAKTRDVALLVVGDPFCATTHSDICLRAKEKNVDVKVIHNASMMSAIAETGLDIYKFGRTTTIVFDDDDWLPETPYEIIKENLDRGLHTLCLLDIKVAEPSRENLRRGVNKAEPSRYMEIGRAISILEKLERKKKQKVIAEDMMIVGVARLGSADQKIASGSLAELKKTDFGGPMHCLVIPGKLHDIEKGMLGKWN